MGLSTVVLPPLTIPNGQTVSNVLNANKCYDDAESIMLFAPAALDAITFVIETNPDPEATSASSGWVELQVGDPVGDAAPPSAGHSRNYYELATAPAFRIKASVAVGSDHTWRAAKSCYA